MDLWGVFIVAGVTAFGGMFASGIQSFIKSRTRSNSDTLKEISDGLKMSLKVQGVLLASNKTLLEVAKGQCNGNVETALENIEGATKEHNDYIYSRA